MIIAFRQLWKESKTLQLLGIEARNSGFKAASPLALSCDNHQPSQSSVCTELVLCKKEIDISTSPFVIDVRVNVLHAWTVNSVYRLVKNLQHIKAIIFPIFINLYYKQVVMWTDWLRIPKHITAITFTSKPNIYPSIPQASSLAFVMQMSKHSWLLACDGNG